MENDESFPDTLERALKDLREYRGAPGGFWSQFLRTLHEVTEASGVYLFLKNSTANREKDTWESLGHWPAENAPGIPSLDQALSGILDIALNQGRHVVKSSGKRPVSVAAISLLLGDSKTTEQACVVLVFPEGDEAGVAHSVEKVRLLADRPAIFQLARDVIRYRQEAETLSSVLDLLLLLNRERRFLSGAMCVCNELSSRVSCERVSLGWYHNGIVKLVGMSHSEKFEKKMELVRSLELSMEECVDQSDAVVWPAPSGSDVITRDHENYARAVNADHLCSIPLYSGGEICAILLFERREAGFGENDILQLQIFADQLGPRLADLRKSDRWFGARWYYGAREQLAKLVGVRNTFWKVAGIIVAILLGILLFGRMTYHVEAPFSLKSDDVVFVTAPFNGYLEEVHVEVGNPVKAGELLCQFDTKELLLEKSITSADLTRLMREVEIRRAEDSLAEMGIYSAQADRVRAELERIEYRLDQAEVEAPMNGILVEGDLQERVGARFETGEELFRVAQIDTLYGEVQVEESDIEELEAGMQGRLAFKSRPGTPYPLTVERIEPVARTEESGNVFAVRVSLPESPENWWRPGMSGVAKIDAGKRSILWILTHETIDYLRLNFWWW